MPSTRRLFCGALLTSIGCAPVEASYVNCPVPVLLSSVDRVRTSAPTPIDPGAPRETLHASAKAWEGRHSSEHPAPEALTLETLGSALQPTDLRTSEVRLEGVSTGTFVGHLIFSVEDGAWITPKGERVRVMP